MGCESYPVVTVGSKRVLMVTSALAMGGSERQMLATAEGLVALGYEIEIFELSEIQAQFGLEAEFWKLGIRSRRPSDLYDEVVWETGNRSGNELPRFTSLLEHLNVTQIGEALNRAIRDFQPGVVHCWSDIANVIGGLVSTNIGVPRIVLSQRNVPPFRMGVPKSNLYRDAYQLLMRNPNVVLINNSRANTAEYEAWLDLPSGTINLIYNGFSPRSICIRTKRDAAMCRRSFGLRDGTRVVGAVMRFAAEKDPLLWLETAAAIAATYPDVRFLLAGYGELADVIAGKVHELGMAERVILPGPTADVGFMYALMDVFLMTSRFEGVPNVLTEAQAAGVPVVAPMVGGTAEALSNGKTGLLVNDRLVQNLAGAVLKILDEPHWQESASVYGPAFVAERFGQSRMIHETLALYGEPTTPTVEPSQKPDKPRRAQRIRQASANRINQLQAIIDRERRGHAAHLADMQRTFDGEHRTAAIRIRELEASLQAEHHASVARIRELETGVEAERHAHAGQIADAQRTFGAERQAAVARIGELETTLHAERDAFIARIGELESIVEADRRAHAGQIADAQRTLGAERRAVAARIQEIETTLHAERHAFVARIRELESIVEADRRAHAGQIADAQRTFGAERQAAAARIQELEATLDAERGAFVARIRELEAGIERLKSVRWFGLGAILAAARKWVL
jgi:glycosyltransferase involved in cell wall biosynthesis